MAIDGITTATPLSSMKFDKVFADTGSMFLGNIGGSIGETSVIAVLIGGLFLIVLGIANWRIPVSMIIGTIIFGGLFWLIDPATYPTPWFHLFAGGFMFGAMFMATDMVTSPVTGKGMWIFGSGIALIMIVIRLFGGLPEGVMYSILLMNATVPLINRYTRPRIFGEAKA
jgi:Na+-translocating ferredoxin:NAD+ oxidoreductase subunit D